MIRRSLPAGLPSRFISNVTTRNQFTKVLPKPSLEHQRQNYFIEVGSANSSPDRDDFLKIGTGTIKNDSNE